MFFMKHTLFTLSHLHPLFRWLTPNGGTLLMLLAFFLTQNVWAHNAQTTTAAPSSNATTIHYQGHLSDAQGNPLNTSIHLTFILYDAMTGGNAVWGPESHTAVPVSEGVFSLRLGTFVPFTSSDFADGSEHWLEVIVNGETLSPREPFAAVPYAMNSSGGSSSMPVGTVISWWRADETTPLPSDEWAIADGSTVTDPASPLYGKTLPDMTERFAMGVAVENIGQLGGNNSLNLAHTHQVNDHVHSIPGHSHTLDHDHHTQDAYAVAGGSLSVHRDITGVTVTNTGDWAGTTGGSQPGTTSALSASTDIRPAYVGMIFLVKIK
jgi:hypothetical protein